MNLLPKGDVNFAEKDYWETFFKNRNNKEFEWYGEYPELCSQLHKYIKPKDDLLVVGCGNSQLSSNLYDVGYKKISNIDLSAVVIKQMKSVNKDRNEMTFTVMDALNMAYADGSYSAVLDKGTLDALMPQDTSTDIERGQRLFSEVDRVLKVGGRYVVISLLQSHILRTLVEECNSRGWMIRICRCHDVEQKTLEEFHQLRMPVFMIVCTKFRKLATAPPIMELCLTSVDKPIRESEQNVFIRAVKEIQEATAMCNAVQKQTMKDELEMEYRRDGDATPRYTIRVVDRSDKGDVGKKLLRSYGALIVPHGRETEWMFGTTEGRELLRKTSLFDRLAVVSLHRDHSYSSMEEIQRELANCVKQLAPSTITSHIPYVTVGDGIGCRVTMLKATSQLSGDFIVEDVTIAGDRYRRLIFLNNQAVVQSEAKLKMDSSFVSCTHHCFMGVAVAVRDTALAPAATRALILGLGGGGLCIFLQRMFPQLTITAIDIDPAIISVAKQQFGVCDNDNLKIKEADGLEFIKTCALSGTDFDVVMIDVDAKINSSPLQCPPEDFVSDITLQQLKTTVSGSGIVVFNIVCRVESLKDVIIERIKKHFGLVARYRLEEDVNEVIFASHNADMGSVKWKAQLEDAASFLNKQARKKLARTDDLLDAEHFIKTLSCLP